MKFKVGDRVIVYWHCNIFYKGAVVAVGDTGALSFVSDNEIALDVHPKQCRLLKKKERRRIWILAANSPANMCPGQIQVYDCPGDDRIEFIEVKKK